MTSAMLEQIGRLQEIGGSTFNGEHHNPISHNANRGWQHRVITPAPSHRIVERLDVDPRVRITDSRSHVTEVTSLAANWLDDPATTDPRLLAAAFEQAEAAHAEALRQIIDASLAIRPTPKPRRIIIDVTGDDTYDQAAFLRQVADAIDDHQTGGELYQDHGADWTWRIEDEEPA